MLEDEDYEGEPRVGEEKEEEMCVSFLLLNYFLS